MDEFETLQDHLTQMHPSLPRQLRRAATYILENPGDVATLSMRKLASQADVALPNFARLAKAAGFETYDELRDVYRKHVQSRDRITYEERAKKLQFSGADKGAAAVWSSFRDAARDSIRGAFDQVDAALVSSIAREMNERRRIYLAGMQSSHSFMRYLHYIAGMASPSITLVGHEASVIADDLADLGDGDAIVCLAIRPCARTTVEIAQIARQRGALVIGITDSRASPLASLSDRLLLAPVESPMFFESYVGAVAIIEMLVGFFVIGEGPSALERIERIEADRRQLGEYWNDADTE